MTERTALKLALYCPRCRQRHLDLGKWATRLHHVHRCAFCGHEWDEGHLTCGVPEYKPGEQPHTPRLSPEREQEIRNEYTVALASVNGPASYYTHVMAASLGAVLAELDDVRALLELREADCTLLTIQRNGAEDDRDAATERVRALENSVNERVARLEAAREQPVQSFPSYLFNLFQRLKHRPVHQTVFWFTDGHGCIFDYPDDPDLLALKGEKE